MKHNLIQISHNRVVKLQAISAKEKAAETAGQNRYFVIEVDDNEWQNTQPDGETDTDLQTLKQEPAQTPIGIITVTDPGSTFSFDGDLTITAEDQQLIFDSIK